MFTRRSAVASALFAAGVLPAKAQPHHPGAKSTARGVMWDKPARSPAKYRADAADGAITRSASARA